MPSWLTLLLILIVIAVLVVAAIGTLMALWILRPKRLTDGRAIFLLRRLSPADLEIPYSDIHFDIRDQRGQPLRIAGWWMASQRATDRCVILLHGYGDAKVGVIAWAPTFAKLNCNLLAVDLRAHGESGGRYTTGGYFEREDIARVIDQLRAEYPIQTKKLVLFGASLGSAVAAAVAAGRDDLAGVILDSPIVSYRHATNVHAYASGMPVGPLFRLGVRLAEKISGADFEAVRTVDMLPQIRCPILMITGGADEFITEPALSTLLAAIAQRPPTAGIAVHWYLPQAWHLGALTEDADEYRRHIEEFLAQIT